MKKITLNKFQEIKNQIIDIINDINYTGVLGILEKRKVITFVKLEPEEINNINQIVNKLRKLGINSFDDLITYTINLQNQLLEYDLSDIPFEDWKDYVIVSDEEHFADFSKTKANIDFALVKYYGNANFKECNVRNLDKISINALNSKDFSESVVKMNSDIFLTDIFSLELKDKYYNNLLTIDDLINLSKEQINELKLKKWDLHTKLRKDKLFFLNEVDWNKGLLLYKHSKEEYLVISSILYNLKQMDINEYNKIIDDIKKAKIEEIKDLCFNITKKRIIESKNTIVDSYLFPELFVKENSDIFLDNTNIPNEVKERYKERRLTIEDYFNYKNIFINIPIDNFISNRLANFFTKNYGIGVFQQLLEKYPKFFKHLSSINDLDTISYNIKKGENYESDFINAIKEYLIRYGNIEQYKEEIDDKIYYNLPSWLDECNFKVIDKIATKEELLQLDESYLVVNDIERFTLNNLGINNILKFEKETNFFTHKSYDWSKELEMFIAVATYCYLNNIDFQNRNLSYEDFLNEFANLLDIMRKNCYFSEYPPYDWMQGEFREKHPEIFMDINAPIELKNAFYKGRITINYIFSNPEYVKYLKDKNLVNVITDKIIMKEIGLRDEKGRGIICNSDFIELYIEKYGNNKLLNLICIYGPLLSNLEINNFKDDFEDEEKIEKAIREAIYLKIINNNSNYEHLKYNHEMVKEHPDIFIDLTNLEGISPEEKNNLYKSFYNGNMVFEDIKKYPQLIKYLKDKNLFVAFGNAYFLQYWKSSFKETIDNDLLLINVLGNQKFLELCSKYGKYMEGFTKYLVRDNIDINYVSKDIIPSIIEEYILDECINGNMRYHEDDAPNFLKKKCPDIFLNNDAPEDLKNYFYNIGNHYKMTFKVLHEHKEWLPYLKDKNIILSLEKCYYLKNKLSNYFIIFGDEIGLKLGINKPETVTKMIELDEIETMKIWYDKTGGRFIPDYVVMQNLKIEDIDKFLANGSNWSKLMKIKSFASTFEGRDAMLKLAYSFGVFDNDQKGFKKVYDLLTCLPRKITEEQGYIFKQIDNQINTYSQRGVFYKNKATFDEFGNKKIESPNMTLEEKEAAYNKMIEYIKNHQFIDLLDTQTLLNLLETIKQENVNIDFSKDIFSQIYRKNEDGSYTLIFNYQSYPKTSQIIRNILEKYNEMPIITPQIAHRLLGGFILENNIEFREFFLSNLDEIFSNNEYLNSIAEIQRRFNEIKIKYSNVHLTLGLALSYINDNRYEGVNVGNEYVPEVAAFNNYSEEDFRIIQSIFNYSRQRVFSSIPRIKSNEMIELSSGRYQYEIVRLDSVEPFKAGKESDCCQQLHHPAEVCMEHSITSKHGRLFEVRDLLGRLVAQSWVWRNKNIICFDNIEVPDQQMWDHGIPKGRENSGIRNKFTDDVLEIYKKAALELIEKDNKTYLKLLQDGKITEEQYRGLRLNKVTIGLGYSNIKGSFEVLERDSGDLSRPLSYEPPVILGSNLYTNDSNTQFILEKTNNEIGYDGDTIVPYTDEFTEFNDTNFPYKLYNRLNNLEANMKDNTNYLDTQVDDDKHIVSSIAQNYYLNPETTKIITNPNFAIIYDVNDNKVTIGDILYITKINDQDITNKVLIQLRLAFEQITKDKKVDISRLEKNKQEMYIKAMELNDELDIERGLRHGK